MLKQNKEPMALDDTPKGRKGIEDMLNRMTEIEKDDKQSADKETA